MKKTFTILFSVGMVLSATAQRNYQSGDDFNNKNQKQVVVAGQHKNGFESSAFSAKEKERQLKEIDKKYDWKIDQVKQNRRMSRREKSKQINLLEDQRSKEIRQVKLAFEKNSYQYKDGRNNDRKW